MNTNITENQKKRKIKFLKWNGEINLGNILTIVAILIAFLGLLDQRQVLKTKVDDLQKVVNGLEKEKQDRELLGLQLDEKRINSFAYNLNYTYTELQTATQLNDEEFIMQLSEINSLIDLLFKKNTLKPFEKEKYNLLKDRNLTKQEILAISDSYITESRAFHKKYSPQRENYQSNEEYNLALANYTDTLQKHLPYLLNVIDSSLQKPKQKLKEIEVKYSKL